MAKARKGFRHPYAWNPNFGWQLLRRSKSYHKAVAQFLMSAKKAKDTKSSRAFTNYCIDSYPSSLKELQYWEDAESDQFAFRSFFPKLKDRDLGNYLPQFPLDTPYFCKFICQFGDIIRFPLNPDYRAPEGYFLNAIWNLRPSLMIGEQYEFVASSAKRIEFTPNHASDRSHILKLMINTNFSEAAIMDTLHEYIQRYLNQHRKDKEGLESFAPRWSDFQSYLDVWDLRESSSNRDKKFGAQKIGDKLCNSQDPDTRKEWAKTRLKYMEKIMPFFERKTPKLKREKIIRHKPKKKMSTKELKEIRAMDLEIKEIEKLMSSDLSKRG